MFILDKEGKIACSNDERNIGLDRSGDDYFIEGKKGTFIKDAYYSNTTGKESIAFASPILCETNGCLGVAVTRIEMSVLNEIASESTGLGESGEIYLINQEGYMITDSKFKQDTFLKEKIESINAKNCLSMLKALESGEKSILEEEQTHEHEHEDHESSIVYLDYLAIEVLGSHHTSHLMHWCVLAEINEEEAFGKGKNQLIKTAILIFIFIFIIAILGGIFITRLISKPIKELTNTVEEVTKGKLDIQLPKSKITEIQKLTTSLNRILASLKLAILKTGATKENLGLGQAFEEKKESEDTYKKLYESSDDAIMILDPKKGSFVDGNPATFKMFNVESVEEFIQISPWAISPEKQPNGKTSQDEAKKMMDIAMKEGSNEFDWVHKRLNGENFNARVSLNKFELKGEEVLQAKVKDLSPKKSERVAIKKIVGKPAVKKVIKKKVVPVKKVTIPIKKVISKPVVKKITTVTKPAIKKTVAKIPTDEEVKKILGKNK